uniref:Uncharacterized protein n=1 Tax=Arundo donax TaxID=35708 RepID=A0A0A9DQA9_ARUDO
MGRPARSTPPMQALSCETSRRTRSSGTAPLGATSFRHRRNLRNMAEALSTLWSRARKNLLSVRLSTSLAFGSCASTTALSSATLSHSPSPAAPPPAFAISSSSSSI